MLIRLGFPECASRDFGIAFADDLREGAVVIDGSSPENGRPPNADRTGVVRLWRMRTKRSFNVIACLTLTPSGGGQPTFVAAQNCSWITSSAVAK